MYCLRTAGGRALLPPTLHLQIAAITDCPDHQLAKLLPKAFQGPCLPWLLPSIGHHTLVKPNPIPRMKAAQSLPHSPSGAWWQNLSKGISGPLSSCNLALQSRASHGLSTPVFLLPPLSTSRGLDMSCFFPPGVPGPAACRKTTPAHLAILTAALPRRAPRPHASTEMSGLHVNLNIFLQNKASSRLEHRVQHPRGNRGSLTQTGDKRR